MTRINIYDFIAIFPKINTCYFTFQMPQTFDKDMCPFNSYVYFIIENFDFHNMFSHNEELNENTSIYNVSKYEISQLCNVSTYTMKYILDVRNAIRMHDRVKDKIYKPADFTCCEDCLEYFDLRNYIYVYQWDNIGGYIFFTRPIEKTPQTFHLIKSPSKYASSTDNYIQTHWKFIELSLRESINNFTQILLSSLQEEYETQLQSLTNDYDAELQYLSLMNTLQRVHINPKSRQPNIHYNSKLIDQFITSIRNMLKSTNIETGKLIEKIHENDKNKID